MASVTYTFSPSTTAASAQVNQNFTDCINAINQNTPSGIIAMWSGAIAAIPVGWYLCDGTNGTPDMRDKFIVGAGNSYAVDDSGGEAAHALTVAELAIHHHQEQVNTTNQSGGAGIQPSGSSNVSSPSSSVMPVTLDTGSGTAHNNLPPYLALAFIQKA